MKFFRSSNGSGNQASSNEAWPLKLNRVLIGLGIIAFGLIVTDRLLEAFRASGTPEDVTYIDGSQAGDAEQLVIAPAVTAPVDSTPDAALDSTSVRKESMAQLQALFGSRVVFVAATVTTNVAAPETVDAQAESAAETAVTSVPGYVVTEDSRRVAVGEVIEGAITLAEVTTHQVILDNGGELMIFNLPDPVVQ